MPRNALHNIASGEGKTDLTKAKTVGLHRTGGNPSFAPDKPAAVANPTFPADQPSTDNIPQTTLNVNGNKGSI